MMRRSSSRSVASRGVWVGGASLAAALLAGCSSPAEAPPEDIPAASQGEDAVAETFNVFGYFAVPSSNEEECEHLWGRYDDYLATGQVTIGDSAGEVVGLGALDEPYVELATREDGVEVPMCVYTYTVIGVTSHVGPYSVAIGQDLEGDRLFTEEEAASGTLDVGIDVRD